MGLKYNTYLDGNKIYGCHKCQVHLADHEQILSRVSSLLSIMATCLSCLGHSHPTYQLPLFFFYFFYIKRNKDI